MSLTHAREKYGAAIRGMAIGADRIQSRLAHAFVSSLIHVSTERDVPEYLREEHEAIMASIRMHSAELPGEGAAHASMRALSDDEARTLAERIIVMSYSLDTFEE